MLFFGFFFKILLFAQPLMLWHYFRWKQNVPLWPSQMNIYIHPFIQRVLSERICSYGSTSFFIEWRWNVINQILFSLNGGVPLLWTLFARPEFVWIITKGNRSQKVKTGAWRWCKKTDKKVTVKIYEMNIPTHKNQLLPEQDVCACSEQW